MHELGHAMHVLLSRTRLQILSGARGPADFIEVPSHVTERLAWESGTLLEVGRHHVTGAAVPAALARRVEESRSAFASVHAQSQVFYAMVDQALHGAARPRRGGGTTEVVDELYEEFMGFERVRGVHRQLRFAHLAWYCSAYYSYLYADAIAAKFWGRVRAADGGASADRALVGLRESVLERGCSSVPLTSAVGRLLPGRSGDAPP